MTTLDAARARLVTLQIESNEQAALLAEEADALQRIQRQRDARDAEQQKRRDELAQARKDLDREERLAAAQERAGFVEHGVEELTSLFTSIAEGKPWFAGTGNNDAVMTHQWQAMMFGAVAKRWILGDGVGLGKTRTFIGWLDLIGARKVIIEAEANICAQIMGELEEIAPHRQVIDLSKRTAAVRHDLLDYATSTDDMVLIVNFEMWRRDKDALAKLMMWQADTVIVDEAHNLKSTSTSNYSYANQLISVDNTCRNCGQLIFGVYDPEALAKKPSRKIPRPCEHCGWKIGSDDGFTFTDDLERVLSTRSVKNVCFVTGTPILNDPVDLFSLLHLSNPVLFTSKASFQTTYLVQGYGGKWAWRGTAMKNLKPFIEGLFIARTLADTGVELPPQHARVIPIELDEDEYPKQFKAIQQLSKAAQLVLDSGESMTVMHLIALITRKRQANVWPGGIVMKDTDKNSPTYGDVIFDAGEIDESVKMDRILDSIKEHHALGHRQIVFSQFKTGIREFAKRIEAAGIRAAVFDGDTEESKRLEIKRNFDRKYNEPAKWDILLANYKTGGTGLNFTAATVSHEMDEEWNPGKRDQSRGRSNRIGQTEENFVFTYRIKGSIDTWMANTIKRKEGIVETFADTMTADREQEIEDLKMALINGEML